MEGCSEPDEKRRHCRSFQGQCIPANHYGLTGIAPPRRVAESLLQCEGLAAYSQANVRKALQILLISMASQCDKRPRSCNLPEIAEGVHFRGVTGMLPDGHEIDRTGRSQILLFGHTLRILSGLGASML